MDKEDIGFIVGESRRPRRKKWGIVPVFELPHCCAAKIYLLRWDDSVERRLDRKRVPQEISKWIETGPKNAIIRRKFKEG